MRNAIKRITHKERSQPSERRKLGLLEKHKDYVERATNFKNKQKYLKSLRRKASERNEDEFYFHMHNSKLKHGKHVEKGKTELDKETVDLMKTQDLAYIIHKKQVDQKKVERLRQSVHLIGDVAPKKHTVFVDNEEEVADFDPVEHFQTIPELVDRPHNRLRASQLDDLAEQPGKVVALEEAEDTSPGRKRKLSREMREIKERTKRAKRLEDAYFELSQQRNLSTAKGAKKKMVITKTVGKEGKEKEVVIYKWRRERAK